MATTPAAEEKTKPACPACGNPPSSRTLSKNGYSFCECSHCDTLFIHPLPSAADMAAYYQRPNGDQVSTICWTSTRRHLWGRWAWALNKVRSTAGEGPLLDIGCGAGQFLAFAQREGWKELSGVELSADAATAARQVTGLVIHTSPLEELALSTGSLAGVVMWDVIEHFVDMRAALREIWRVIRPGGVLLLGTPNCRGLGIRFLGAGSTAIIPPEHLTLFSRKGLRTALEYEGFETLQIRSTGIYLRDWTNWLRSFTAGGAPASPAAVEADNNIYGKLTRQGLFLAAMNAANVVLELTRLGDELLVFARKPQA